MNDEFIYKIVKAYLPDARGVKLLKTIENDDQDAYLISAISSRVSKTAKLILFENGMSGRYIDEDEAVMELTDGLPIRGWFHVGDGKILKNSDVKCKYKLPAGSGYNSYFELAIAE